MHRLVTPPREALPTACPRVIGAGKPCRGVFLVGRLCAGAIYVCNPSTGGLLRLPPRRPPWYLHSAGIGLHAATRQHKVVLLERVEGLPQSWWIPRLQCHLVTVGDRQRRWWAPRGKKTSVIRDVVVPTDTDPVFADGRGAPPLDALAGVLGARRASTASPCRLSPQLTPSSTARTISNRV